MERLKDTGVDGKTTKKSILQKYKGMMRTAFSGSEWDVSYTGHKGSTPRWLTRT
jgi:hypothetical protein